MILRYLCTIIAFGYLINCSANSSKDKLFDQNEFSTPEIQFTEAMLFFDNQQYEIAKNYGIKTNFKIPYQRMLGQHMVAVLVK